MNKKMKKNRPVMIDETAQTRLAWISKVSGRSRKSILEEIIEEMTSLACMYDKAYLKIESSVLASEVRIVVMGYGKKIKAGSFRVGSETSESKINRLIAQELGES